MNNNTKLVISTIAFLVIIYISCRFYLATSGGNPAYYGLSNIILVGIILIVAIGVVSTSMYYYWNRRNGNTAKGMRLNAELGAYEIIAKELKNDHLIIGIPASMSEIVQLQKDNKIRLTLSRFNTLIEAGNHIRLYTNDDSKTSKICKIMNIDNHNKTVCLVVLPNNDLIIHN